MTKTQTATMQYYAIEDNGGGLTLVVTTEDGCAVYMHGGYEYVRGALARDLAALAAGDDPCGWDGCEETEVMEREWAEIEGDPQNYRTIANGVVGSAPVMHDDIMGAAARRECGGAL